MPFDMAVLFLQVRRLDTLHYSQLRQHCMNVMWRNVLRQGILAMDGVSIFGLQADKTATRGTLE
jgi:hypothetical protein